MRSKVELEGDIGRRFISFDWWLADMAWADSHTAGWNLFDNLVRQELLYSIIFAYLRLVYTM